MPLEDWKRQQIQQHGVLELYHLTAISNLQGILSNGILPRAAVGSSFADIANGQVLELRRGRTVNLGNAGRVGLHEVALLFFTPLTPMHFRVLQAPGRRDSICIVTVDPQALCGDELDIAFGDGNLANSATRSYYDLRRLDEVRWDVIWAPFWTEFPDEGVRCRSAEFVVSPGVPVNAITGVVVASPAARKQAERAVASSPVVRPVTVEATLFFAKGQRPALEKTALFPPRPERVKGPPIPPPPGDDDAPPEYRPTDISGDEPLF